MPAGTKGLIHQVTFVMVDKTDFASVESGVAAASVTGKLFGVNHKDSTFTSTASTTNAVALINSGIFRLVVTAAENNKDRMLLRLKNNSSADQHIIWENESDMSVLLSMVSDLDSQIVIIDGTGSNLSVAIATQDTYLIGLSGAISDVESQLDVTASKVLLNQSRVSDILIDTATLAGMSNTLSQVLVDTADLSDMRSDIRSLVSTQGGVTVSQIWGIDASSVSTLNSIGSLVVKTLDDMVPGISNTLSQVFVDTTGISDITSQILADTVGISDITSKILADTATLAGMSNVLSQVFVDTAGNSNIISQILVDTATLAGMSDTLSQVLIDTAEIGASGVGLTDIPGMGSPLFTGTASAGTTTTLTDASLVEADTDHWKGQTLKPTSGGIAGQCRYITDFNAATNVLTFAPALTSAIVANTYEIISGAPVRLFLEDTIDPGATLNLTGTTINTIDLLGASAVSDIGSRVTVVLASSFSDILSGVVANASQLLLVKSNVSDIQSALDSDVIVRQSQFSDIQSNIDAVTASVSASDISDIASAVWAEKWRVHSLASSFGSLFSVVGTGVDNTESRTLRTMSDTSDILVDTAQIGAAGAGLTAVPMTASDISDLRSAITAGGAISASDMSDLRSAITAQGGVTASDMSDLRSAITVGPTDVQLNASSLSDLRSAITAQGGVTASDMSDLRSAITVGPGTYASDVSDIISRLALIQSDASDIASRVTGAVATKSEVASAVWSEKWRVHSLASSFGSLVSVIATGVDVAESRTLRTMSDTSDILVDTAQIGAAGAGLTAVPMTASDISDLRSAITAQGGVTASDMSDLRSAITVGPTSVTLSTSGMSDLRSAITAGGAINASDMSDIRSAITAQGGVTASDMSDLRSAITAGPTDVQLNASSLSDIRSAITVGGAINASDMSDLRSAITAQGGVTASDMSDLRSAITVGPGTYVSDISDILSRLALVQSDTSDLASRITGPIATKNDFTSAVWAEKWRVHSLASSFGSLFSVIGTGVDNTESRTLRTMSDTSDLVSRVSKEVASKSLLSDVRSDLASQIGGITATVSASDISDIASAVWAEKWRVHSLASSFGSLFSVVGTGVDNTESRTLRTMSDTSDILVDTVQIGAAGAGLTAVPMTASDISDLRSAITAQGGVTASDMSDLRSAITAGPTDVTLSASDISDLRSAITAGGAISASDMSDLRSAITAQGGVTASDMSDLRSAITAGPTDVQLNASSLSDIRSAISAGPAATVTASDISDIASAVWAEKWRVHSLASSFGSLFSVIGTGVDNTESRALRTMSDTSDLASRITAAPATKSDLVSAIWGVDASSVSTVGSVGSLIIKTLDDGTLSDITSKISAGVAMTASDLSDIRSAISAGPAATVTASDISDIASAVQASIDANGAPMTASDLSDLRSAITAQGGVTASDMSDLRSAITAGPTDVTLGASSLSDLRSAITVGPTDVTIGASSLSDLRSAITAGGAMTASDISDIRSAITAGPTDVQLNASSLSDLRSAITVGPTTVTLGTSDMSDLRSAITAGGINASGVSDIASAVKVTLASDISDILSGVVANAGQIALVKSNVSDVESAVDALMGTDTLTELGAIPSATPTRDEALLYLYQYFRNKRTQTASRLVMFKDDGTTELASAVISDDATTFTKGEFGTPL